MAKLQDPEPAPAPPRAKDLKGKVVLLKPGQYFEEQSARDDKPWTFVKCEVIVLNGEGIESRSEDVRISWARVLPQLRKNRGQWIACRPVEEDGAVVFDPLEGEKRAVAERVLAEIDGD